MKAEKERSQSVAAAAERILGSRQGGADSRARGAGDVVGKEAGRAQASSGAAPANATADTGRCDAPCTDPNMACLRQDTYLSQRCICQLYACTVSHCAPGTPQRDHLDKPAHCDGTETPPPTPGLPGRKAAQ